MKRVITEHQEQILRLVHHDFDGLSQVEAAKKLGISQSAISNALVRIKKIMPQMFPLLTKIEIERYHLYAIEGWSVNNIAEYLEVTPDSVYKALKRAKDKGMFFPKPKDKVLSYNSGIDTEMDEHIKHKF